MTVRYSLPFWVGPILLMLVCGLAPVGATSLGEDRTGREKRLVRATFIGNEGIALDGCLCEEIWTQAEVAGGFVQSAPVEGAAPTEATEARFLYDRDFLYVGLVMFDSETDKLITNSLKRDFPPGDTDIVMVALDTMGDGRNSMVFETNPGGAVRDAQGFDNGRFINNEWDAVWFVEAQVFEDRWEVEFQIPFKTLRFERSRSLTFGMNIYRNVRRKNERSYWSPVPRQFSIFSAAHFGELAGINDVEPGRDFRIKPFSVGRAGWQNRSESQNQPIKGDGGVDVKYGITGSLTLDASYRTDFSQVEVDEQQVNLTRFSLFFPEKREFFLENQGFFQIGDVAGRSIGDGPASGAAFIPFFSRRIGLTRAGEPVPILGGVRVTGKIHDYGIGAVAVQTEDANLEPSTTFLVLRGYRDLLEGSSVGGFFLNRDAAGGLDYNRVVGADANFNLLQNRLSLVNYLMRSEASDEQGDGWAARSSVSYRDGRRDVSLSYTRLGERFRNDLGFLPRRGVHAASGTGRLRWRPWPRSYWREFSPSVSHDYLTDHENRLLNRWSQVGFKVETGGGGSIEVARFWEFERFDRPFRIHPEVTVPAGDYDFSGTGLSFTSDRERQFFGSVRYSFGDFYEGDRQQIRATADWRPSPHFQSGITWSRNQIELPGGDFTVHAVGARIDIFFTRTLYLNTFLQFNSQRNEVLSTVRLNFIHRPLSDLFIVFTEGRSLEAVGLRERTLIVKFSRLFSF